MNCPYCLHPLPLPSVEKSSRVPASQQLETAGHIDLPVSCGTCGCVLVVQVYSISKPRNPDWLEKLHTNNPAGAETYCHRCSRSMPLSTLNTYGGLCKPCWELVTSPKDAAPPDPLPAPVLG